MSDWSPIVRLLLAVLATWRLAHLVAAEDGPFDLIVGLRKRAGDGFFGSLMDCPYCLSLWFAIPFTFLLVPEPAQEVANWLTCWLAISGGACLCEALTHRR